MDTQADRRELTASGLALAIITTVFFVTALLVRGGIVFGLLVLAAVFISLERLFALHPQRVLRAGWRTDLVHFAVNNLVVNLALVLPLVTAGLALRAAVPAALRHDIADEAAWLQFAEAFLLAEVCGYAAHRAAHRVPLLWRLHEVHHSIREMDRLAAPVRDAASPSGPYARPLRGRRGAALRLPPPAGVAVSPRSAGSPIAGGILVVAFSAARAATAATA